MPNTPFIAVSQKIKDSEKEELKKFISDKFPKNAGGIIRTNAVSASSKEILEDLNNLISLWETIQNLSVEKFPKQI